MRNIAGLPEKGQSVKGERILLAAHPEDCCSPPKLPGHLGSALPSPATGCLRLLETQPQRHETVQGGKEALCSTEQRKGCFGSPGLSPTCCFWHVDLVPAVRRWRPMSTGAPVLTGVLPFTGAYCPDSAGPLASWNNTKPRSCAVLSSKGNVWGQAKCIHDHFCFAFLSAASSAFRYLNPAGLTNSSTQGGASHLRGQFWARAGKRPLACA